MLRSFDKKIEQTLRQRRRDGRHMPEMVVIPPGLDFSSLKVDLPKDPALEEMKQIKPAFGGSPVASEAGSPRQRSPQPMQRGASMANLRSAAADSDKPLPQSSLVHSRTGSGLPRPMSMSSLRAAENGGRPGLASFPGMPAPST